MNRISGTKSEELRRLSTAEIIAVTSVISLAAGTVIYMLSQKSSDSPKSIDNGNAAASTSISHSGDKINDDVDKALGASVPLGAKQDYITRLQNTRDVPKALLKNLSYADSAAYANYHYNGILKDPYEYSDTAKYTDPYIYNLARYYVNLVHDDISQDYEKPSQLREHMWNVAQQAFDEFVAQEIEGKNLSNLPLSKMRMAHKARKTIIQYLDRIGVVILSHSSGDTARDELGRTANIMEAIDKQAKDPRIAICLDIVFANFAYIASIEHKNHDDKNKTLSTQVTADYIASTLAHIAYVPCSMQIPHFRSANQKRFCLNKLAVYSAAYTAILEPTLTTNVDEARLLKRMEQYAGHAHVLTYLCLINNVATAFCYQALQGEAKPTYVDDIIAKEKNAHTLLFQRATTPQQIMQCKDNDEITQLTALSCEQAIGAALALDTDGQLVRLAKQIFQSVTQLTRNNLSELLNIMIAQTVVPNLTGNMADLFKAMHQLEHSLCHLYITKNHLNIQELEKCVGSSPQLDTVLRQRFKSYKPEVTAELEKILTCPLYTDTKTQAILKTLYFLDPENRTQNLYSPHTDYQYRITTMGDCTTSLVLSAVITERKQAVQAK